MDEYSAPNLAGPDLQFSAAFAENANGVSFLSRKQTLALDFVHG
jgi:hypothetical protein